METPKQTYSAAASVSSSATVRPANTVRQSSKYGPVNMQDGSGLSANNRSDYIPKDCLDVSTLPRTPTLRRMSEASD